MVYFCFTKISIDLHKIKGHESFFNLKKESDFFEVSNKRQSNKFNSHSFNIYLPLKKQLFSYHSHLSLFFFFLLPILFFLPIIANLHLQIWPNISHKLKLDQQLSLKKKTRKEPNNLFRSVKLFCQTFSIKLKIFNHNNNCLARGKKINYDCKASLQMFYILLQKVPNTL